MFRPPRSARNTLTIVASVRPIELSIDGRVLIDELSAIESGGARVKMFLIGLAAPIVRLPA
jgi:hypothetical protein